MRLSKLTHLAATSILIIIVSCSEDDAIEDEMTVVESGNTEADKPGGENSGTSNEDREAAKELYTEFYLASNYAEGDVSWTGNIPSCDPGTIPKATKDKIFMRLAYFRKAVGLNNDITENDTKSRKAQQAALMMHANGDLDHSPPSSWECYTEDGSEAAGNSLLTSTRNAPAIDSYIRDQGDENFPVGHRRWLLWPRLQEVGLGNTSSYNAVWVIGDGGPVPSDAPDFISWPPEGFLPQNMAYDRWSFSIAQADFTETNISMRVESGSNLPLEIEELSSSFGDATIVWTPQIQAQSLAEDTTYIVTLTNVGIDGEPKDFEYEVTLFDPNS